jgi:creatinine amidohydrolase
LDNKMLDMDTTAETPGRLLHGMTRTQANEVAPNTLVVLPVGAVEQHGPHMPLGTDALIVEQVARQAAARLAGDIPVVVAPTLAYGSSHHHLPYGGTMSISTSTYFNVVKELVETLAVSGFRRVFILNGHGGNVELVTLVARDVSASHRIVVGAGSYWIMSSDALASSGAGQLGELPGHAGEFETSMMLALHPELVDEGRPSRDEDGVAHSSRYRFGSPGPFRKPDGFSDSPAVADRQRGLAYFSTCVDSVAGGLREFYDRATDDLGE